MNSLLLKDLRPLQAMAATILFRNKRLMLCLPRQKGGKTELGIRLIHDLVSRQFSSSSLFLAKSVPSAKKAAREKFMRLFPKEDFAVNTEIVYNKKNPTSCCFISSVDKDPDRQRGGTFAMIHWSEVAFSKLEGGESIQGVFDKVINPTLIETKGYVLLESTNNGKNGWYDLWENAHVFGFKKLRVTLSDMVYLGLVSPEEYDEIRSTTQPDVFLQEYECEWISFQGKTYVEYSEDIHVLPDMPGPESWQKVAFAIDWGFTPSATCVLFAYLKDGNIYVFDEYYAKEELASLTGRAIAGKLNMWNIKSYCAVADHEEDRIKELNGFGIPCSKADKVDVLGNRMQIKEKFYFKKLFIHPRCENLRRDLLAIVWHPKNSDKGEIDYNQCTWGHFDAEAALRYLVRAFEENMETSPDILIPNMSDQMSADMWTQKRKMDYVNNNR